MGCYKSLISGIKRNISIINQIGSVTKPMIKMIKPGSKMTKRNMAIIKRESLRTSRSGRDKLRKTGDFIFYISKSKRALVIRLFMKIPEV
jgi:hypothetical protein